MEAIGELRALANPTRLRMLSLLTRGPLSAAEVSRELGIAHGSASFHLRQLAAAGVVRPAEERRRRGGIERRYSLEPESLQRLSPEGVRPFEAAVVRELRRRLALPRGKAPEMISDAVVWARPEDWDLAVREVAEALKRLAAAALNDPAPGLVQGSITALLFPLSPDQDLQ
ncbi:MAG: ArsR/SmtB family transcription factor [Candidatus Dormibacteria bacterium]